MKPFTGKRVDAPRACPRDSVWRGCRAAVAGIRQRTLPGCSIGLAARTSRGAPLRDPLLGGLLGMGQVRRLALTGRLLLQAPTRTLLGGGGLDRGGGAWAWRLGVRLVGTSRGDPADRSRLLARGLPRRSWVCGARS